jgi:hypothetical protein
VVVFFFFFFDMKVVVVLETTSGLECMGGEIIFVNGFDLV